MTHPSRSIRLSCEYFPPKTDEGRHKLLAANDRLQALSPDFVSVTYGAGGSTRTHTRDVVLELARRGSRVAPHLSFGGDDSSIILELLHAYRDAGIRRLVALRGDMPSGIGGLSQMVFAAELVAFVRENTGDHFNGPSGLHGWCDQYVDELVVQAGHRRSRFAPGFPLALDPASRKTRRSVHDYVLEHVPIECFQVAGVTPRRTAPREQSGVRARDLRKRRNEYDYKAKPPQTPSG